MKTGYIYKITSPSGRIYIGQTINLNNRISHYKNLNCKGQHILLFSLTKYGFDNHKFEILFKGEVAKEKLNELEIFYIELYNSFKEKNQKGMNLTTGGSGIKGKTVSEKTKEKIRNTKKNKPPTEKQIQARLNMFGRKINKPEKWIRNNAEAIKKPIIQLDLDGNFVKEWKSAKDVEIELGLSRKNIGQNLKKHTKSAFGFKWVFKKDKKEF